MDRGRPMWTSGSTGKMPLRQSGREMCEGLDWSAHRGCRGRRDRRQERRP